MVNLYKKNEKIELRVTEICKVSYINEEDFDKDFDEELYAKRMYTYVTDSCNFENAISDFINNFDIDCVRDCNDEFDGECLDSKVIKIEVL